MKDFYPFIEGEDMAGAKSSRFDIQSKV